MDEPIDVLDGKTGLKTGETIYKSEAHAKGIWHGAIHILFVNEEHDKTLLQKRCAQKKLYPNMWDITVGGHISAGEDDITSARRELEEELGLNPDDYKFEYMGKSVEMFENGGIKSNEYVSIFVIYHDLDIKNIKLQEEEVSEAKWCTKKELNDFIKEGSIIPHVKEYEILNEILKD